MYLKVLLLVAISVALAKENVIGSTQNAAVFFAQRMFHHSDPYRSIVIAARFDNKTDVLQDVPEDTAHCLLRNRGPALRIISEIQVDFVEKCLSDSDVYGSPSLDDEDVTVVVGDEMERCHKNLLDSAPVSTKVKTFLKEKLVACEKGLKDIDNSFHKILEGNGINTKLFFKETLDKAFKYATKMIGKRCEAMKVDLNGEILTQQAKELLDNSWQGLRNATAKLDAFSANVFKKNAANAILYETHDHCFSAVKLKVSSMLATFGTKLQNCISNLIRLKETAYTDKLALIEKVDALRKKQVKDLKTNCVKKMVGDANYVSEDDGVNSVNCIKSEMLTTVEEAIRNVELETADYIFGHYVWGSRDVIAASKDASACVDTLNFDGVIGQVMKQTEMAFSCASNQLKMQEGSVTVVLPEEIGSKKKSSGRTEEL